MKHQKNKIKKKNEAFIVEVVNEKRMLKMKDENNLQWSLHHRGCCPGWYMYFIPDFHTDRGTDPSLYLSWRLRAPAVVLQGSEHCQIPSATESGRTFSTHHNRAYNPSIY